MLCLWLCLYVDTQRLAPCTDRPSTGPVQGLCCLWRCSRWVWPCTGPNLYASSPETDAAPHTPKPPNPPPKHRSRPETPSNTPPPPSQNPKPPKRNPQARSPHPKRNRTRRSTETHKERQDMCRIPSISLGFCPVPIPSSVLEAERELGKTRVKRLKPRSRGSELGTARLKPLIPSEALAPAWQGRQNGEELDDPARSLPLLLWRWVSGFFRVGFCELRGLTP